MEIVSFHLNNEGNCIIMSHLTPNLDDRGHKIYNLEGTL